MTAEFFKFSPAHGKHSWAGVVIGWNKGERSKAIQLLILLQWIINKSIPPDWNIDKTQICISDFQNMG